MNISLNKENLLPKMNENDYPLSNSRLYVEYWLAYALDNSLTSMQDLFKRLNHTSFGINIGTFSKTNTHRSQ
jgi:putative transposase